MNQAELSRLAGVKEETVIRRLSDIRGWKKVDGDIIFLKGTRYPYEKNRVKLKDTLDKYYAILKATNRNRYIDHNYLNVTEDVFSLMTEELVKMGYLQKNNSNNPYGANSYEMTFLSSKIIKKSKLAIIREMREVISDLATITKLVNN